MSHPPILQAGAPQGLSAAGAYECSASDCPDMGSVGPNTSGRTKQKAFFKAGLSDRPPAGAPNSDVYTQTFLKLSDAFRINIINPEKTETNVRATR